MVEGHSPPWERFWVRPHPPRTIWWGPRAPRHRDPASGWCGCGTQNNIWSRRWGFLLRREGQRFTSTVTAGEWHVESVYIPTVTTKGQLLGFQCWRSLFKNRSIESAWKNKYLLQFSGTKHQGRKASVTVKNTETLICLQYSLLHENPRAKESQQVVYLRNSLMMGSLISGGRSAQREGSGLRRFPLHFGVGHVGMGHLEDPQTK